MSRPVTLADSGGGACASDRLRSPAGELRRQQREIITSRPPTRVQTSTPAVSVARMPSPGRDLACKSHHADEGVVVADSGSVSRADPARILPPAEADLNSAETWRRLGGVPRNSSRAGVVACGFLVVRFFTADGRVPHAASTVYGEHSLVRRNVQNAPNTVAGRIGAARVTSGVFVSPWARGSGRSRRRRYLQAISGVSNQSMSEGRNSESVAYIVFPRLACHGEGPTPL